MTLPIGLISVLIFVVTVGIPVPVTLVAHLMDRNEGVPFGSALRAALLEAGLLYLVGVGVIWSIAGGPLWGVPAALIAVGIGTLFGLVALPLIVGQKFIEYFGKIDSEIALRRASYGWPVAMFAVFGIFIAPGGLTQGHLFHLGGAQICLVGFCGITVSLAAAVLLEAFIAVFGPGLIGLLLDSQQQAGHRFLPGR